MGGRARKAQTGGVSKGDEGTGRGGRSRASHGGGRHPPRAAPASTRETSAMGTLNTPHKRRVMASNWSGPCSESSTPNARSRPSLSASLGGRGAPRYAHALDSPVGCCGSDAGAGGDAFCKAKEGA
jgi:hypothetical protein